MDNMKNIFSDNSDVIEDLENSCDVNFTETDNYNGEAMIKSFIMETMMKVENEENTKKLLEIVGDDYEVERSGVLRSKNI